MTADAGEYFSPEENMKKAFFFVILLSLFIIGCSLNRLKENYPIDKKYYGNFTINGKTVPLPAGEWGVAGRGTRNIKDYYEVWLINYNNRTMNGAIYIMSDAPFNNYIGYKKNSYAERKDIYYVEINSNSEGDPFDLWLVNHSVIKLSVKRQANKELYEYLKQRNISIPKLMIQSFHVKTGSKDKGKYLRVEYYYNPELEGFDSSYENDWDTSAWHPLRVSKNPAKVAYLNKVVQQGKILHRGIQVEPER